MGLLQEFRARAQYVLGPLLGVLAVGYFAYHVVQGDRGLFAWWNIKQRVAAAKAALEVSQGERELLENECTNIAVGTWILYDNITRYGEWEAALAAYNAGSPDSPVGQQYANEVLSILGDQYQ